MKNKWIGLFVLILFMLIPSRELFANIGFKTGLNLSFAGQEGILFDPSELYGVKGSLFYSISIGEYFSIQPEINYVKKGNQYYCTVCEGIRKANLDYLEIPIVFNVHLLRNTIDIFSGVYFGILLDSITNTVHSWEGRDIVIRKTDYGVSFGARYRLFQFVILELQFNQGLTKVIYETNQTAIKGYKNKTLSFLIGFGF